MVGFNLEADHAKFLDANFGERDKSKFIRFLLDNSEEYKKYIKEKK
jgi:hypothetical protein